MGNHTYNVCLWRRGLFHIRSFTTNDHHVHSTADLLFNKLQLKHEDLLARPLQEQNNKIESSEFPDATCICLSPLNKSGWTLGGTRKEIGVQLLTFPGPTQLQHGRGAFSSLLHKIHSLPSG